MSFHSAAAQMTTLASEGAQHGGNHNSLNELLIGGISFGILMLLLLITVSFNRDR